MPMRFESISVSNFKSIALLEGLPLGQMTVLVGRNNTGKSALIQALYSFQEGGPHLVSGRRVGAPNVSLTLRATEMGANPWNAHFSEPASIDLVPSAPGLPGSQRVIINGSYHSGQIPSSEPEALIYPQLGKRKVSQYRRTVDRASATTVASNWEFLVSRLQRLANPEYPGSEAYRQACEEILGFVVTVYPSEGGQQAGRYVDEHNAIPLEEMGEGVSAVVSMLADLVVARGKLLLVEEPENDLHPEALKALLRLMGTSAETNQFVVTTHSNIVLRYLGALPNSAVIRVEGDPSTLPPTTTFNTVPNTTSARLALLRELGYELADFDLYEGWLILEESSAERLIRQYLLKWFAPSVVGKLRTLSARGTSRIEATFEDFSRLFLYAHLEEVYKERAWVIVDGDASGEAVVERLRQQFGGTWPSEHFRTLSQPHFEHYYPERFQTRVRDVLALPHGASRQTGKERLLYEVIDWIGNDESEAKAEFFQSASDVISVLKQIASTLDGYTPGRKSEEGR